MSTLVVLNPVSAGGRTLRQWPEVAAVLSAGGVEFDLHQTTGPGEATEAVRRALGEGRSRIVAMGGDGTLNEVVNGFFDAAGAPIGEHASLGLIPSGTGGDFRRCAGIPASATAAARLLVDGTIARIDAGRVDYAGGARRFFINVADCGIGGEVVARVNRSSHKRSGAGGSAVFLWESLRTLLTYGGRPVRIDVDGRVIEREVRSVVVANGRYFGGGMHIAPRADLADGVFDVVVVAATGRLAALSGIPALYRGRHLQRREVEHLTGRTVRVEALAEPLLFDVEGEQVGETPATLTCLPGAISLCVAGPSGVH